jgi:hypothetical protein
MQEEEKTPDIAHCFEKEIGGPLRSNRGFWEVLKESAHVITI